jgi:ribosomal protein L14E/L6E/L27E
VVQEQRGQFVNVPRKVVIIGGVVQQQNPKTADLLDITTLLFAESFLPDQGSQRISGVGSVSYMLSQPVFRDALAEGAKNREPLLALVGKWIDTRQDAYTLYTAMNAAQSLKLPHLLPICRKLVDPKTTGPGIYRAMAMTNLAKLGTVKDDLPILEKAFDDATVATTVFINNNKRQQVLMKDLALAMALIMSKQDPIAYGMKSRYSQNNESLKYNYSNYYFDDDEAKADETRKTAFEKYKKWKADQEKNEKK